jgi:transcriptional regulator with XRE-family HTH domain
MSEAVPDRAREELVRALSSRFVELRRKAGMRQQDVAEAMGRERSGQRLVRRLEHGAVANASLCSVAEYLRAVRAGFGSLKDALDRYTSVPIPRPVRRIAEAAPPPRTQADSQALECVQRRADGLPEKRELRSRTPKLPPDLETVRVQRRAGYWVIRNVFEHFLHSELHAIGVSPSSWVRRRMAQYGRKVFNALFRTHGPRESKRPERLARLREWALNQHLTEPLAEYIEFAVGLAFEDMRAHDELDWLPPPAEAYAIMALKPKRRVVTDAQMCLEEWWDAYNRSARACQEVGERARKAASGVLAAAGCDAAVAGQYVRATNWAMNMGCYSAPGTPERKRSVAEFLAARWMAQLDRKLVERLQQATLEVWDSSRSSLPPPPGPKPH